MSNFSMESVVPEGLSRRGRDGSHSYRAATETSQSFRPGQLLRLEVIENTRPEISMELTGPAISPGWRDGHFSLCRHQQRYGSDLNGVKVTAPLFGKFWCNTIGNSRRGPYGKIFIQLYRSRDGAFCS
ncbi:MAG: hypothetical protein ACOX33_00010 [Dethiobacteria bacterium]